MSLEVAVNVNSLRLVEEELKKTIDSATAHFESYLAERHNLSLLEQCQEELHQIAGTLDLLQVPGGRLIAQEMCELVRQSLAENEDISEKRLDALSTAFFALPRYLEFVTDRQADIPLLAVTPANELRMARNAEPLMEHQFCNEEIALFTASSGMAFENKPLPAAELADTLKRLRHMFQVGLLGVLRHSNLELHLRLMARAVQRLCSVVPAGPAQRFWLLTNVVLDCFQHDGLEVGMTRKRLLTVIDKEIRRLSTAPSALDTVAPPAVERELVYLLRISSYRAGVVQHFLKNSGIKPFTVSESELAELRKRMLGPSFETLTSVVKELRSELRNAKDLLEILTQSGRFEEGEIKPLVNTLEQVGDVLRVLNLPSLAELLEQLAQTLHGLRQRSSADANGLFTDVADAILFVESSLDQLDRRQLSQTELIDISHERRHAITTGSQFEESRLLVLRESQAGISLAKRAITSYVESQFDFAHISNLKTTLDTIRGAFQMLGMVRITRVLQSCVSFVSAFIDDRELDNTRKQQLLETLADALISIEYYLGEMTTRKAADESILRIAEESLAALGHPVKAA